MVKNGYRAVVFDLGGVVLGSPLHAIRDFEVERAVPAGTINRHVARSAPDGAWHRLERGELLLGSEFFAIFDAELAALGYELSSEEMFERIEERSQPHPEMLEAIARLRAAGLRVAALTNNWSRDEGQSSYQREDLRSRFDHFIESAKVGLRKPDPRIYELTCRTLEATYEQVVFLDDIGANLKAARALGMLTIKVDEPRPALSKLGEALGLELL